MLVYFLFSDFHFLGLKLHDGNRLSSMLLGLKRMFLNQRMRSKELADPFAERASAVAVNDPDSSFVRQSSIVQEFVQPVRGFFDRHAYYIDFVRSDGFAGSRRYGEIGSGRGLPRPYGTASGYRR